jgi:hypothetical protein
VRAQLITHDIGGSWNAVLLGTKLYLHVGPKPNDEHETVEEGFQVN